MPTLPGGQIIGGVGGRIWMSSYLSPKAYFDKLLNLGPTKQTSGDVDGLDVADWRLSIRTSLAQCPHTGTFGANCRRIVLDDWSFSASVPLDQSNFPDHILTRRNGANGVSGTKGITSRGQNISLVFKLGDTFINPEAVYMEMKQHWYYAPSAYMASANPVLNAAGDVIRMSVSGEACGHIFLLPEEGAWCDEYLTYLASRGWV